MRFSEKTGDAKRGGNLVKSVVRMAKWLEIAVIAEGVEDKAQADYLKSIGDIIYRAIYMQSPCRWMNMKKRLETSSKEVYLTRLKTLQNLDNNDFRYSRSMDIFIYYSNVGEACILELYNYKVKMLRAIDHFARISSGDALGIKDFIAIDWTMYMDNWITQVFVDAVLESMETKECVTAEIEFHNLRGCPEIVILRCSILEIGQYLHIWTHTVAPNR